MFRKIYLSRKQKYCVVEIGIVWWGLLGKLRVFWVKLVIVLSTTFLNTMLLNISTFHCTEKYIFIKGKVKKKA